MAATSPEEVRGRIAAADGIRGFAIILIVLCHLAVITEWSPTVEPLAAWRDAFHLGVDLMFVASGFLLFLPVAARGAWGASAGISSHRHLRQGTGPDHARSTSGAG